MIVDDISFFNFYNNKRVIFLQKLKNIVQYKLNDIGCCSIYSVVNNLYKIKYYQHDNCYVLCTHLEIITIKLLKIKSKIGLNYGPILSLLSELSTCNMSNIIHIHNKLIEEIYYLIRVYSLISLETLWNTSIKNYDVMLFKTDISNYFIKFINVLNAEWYVSFINEIDIKNNISNTFKTIYSTEKIKNIYDIYNDLFKNICYDNTCIYENMSLLDKKLKLDRFFTSRYGFF